VLWSLAEGFSEFPEAPPPGLVTVPAVTGAPRGYYPRAGYRLAGDRAIRIDMLERLADLLRAQDARAGFEATPEMLSITGLTLEQFVKLMSGLGYDAERRTRAKTRPAPADTTVATGADVAPTGETPDPVIAPAPPEGAESPDDAAAAPESAATERDEVAHTSAPEGDRAPAEVGAADDNAMPPEQAPVSEASASPQGAGAADVETSGATPDEPG